MPANLIRYLSKWLWRIWWNVSEYLLIKVEVLIAPLLFVVVSGGVWGTSNNFRGDNITSENNCGGCLRARVAARGLNIVTEDRSVDNQVKRLV